jgi:hypothetical protein
VKLLSSGWAALATRNNLAAFGQVTAQPSWLPMGASAQIG